MGTTALLAVAFLTAVSQMHSVQESETVMNGQIHSERRTTVALTKFK